jgi:hypothetical protein
MASIFSQDYVDFIAAFEKAGVSYMLIGGYSVILHGYDRSTMDMDIWVERSLDNYIRISQAFYTFGMPVFTMTKENFLTNDNYDVYTFGKKPYSIDILNSVKGLDFKSAYPNSSIMSVDGIEVRVIDYIDLIKAKRAAGRLKDLADIEELQRRRSD